MSCCKMSRITPSTTDVSPTTSATDLLLPKYLFKTPNIIAHPKLHDMAPSLTYSLADVLAVAKIHPFYSDTLYPPDQDAIHAAREEAALNYKDADFQSQKLLRKKDL